MKISVVMASYNGAAHIVEQLLSIDNQSLNPDEIIIVDDASTDNTCSLINDFFSKTDITGKLVVHEENKGFKNTFLEALTYADGDLIFLCDQDDVWHRDKIKKIASVMDRNKAVSAINTSYNLIDNDGNPISEGIKNKKRSKGKTGLYNVTLENVLKYNVAMGCTMAVKKSVADKLVKYMESVKSFNLPHDWMLNIVSAVMDNGLYMLNEELISYRIHGNNTIGLNRAFCIDDRIKDYESMAEQKKEMLRLIKLIDKKTFNKEYDFMKLMVKSYYIRCELLAKKSIISYILGFKKYKMYNVMDMKTLLYDLFLIIKRK